MARPSKSEPERRRKTRLIRLTETEDRRIREIAEAVQLTVSDYLRTIALHGKVQVHKEAALPFPLIQELNKIGVNLNQQTRKFNATGRSAPAALASTLDRLNALLDEVQGYGPERH